ncbi:MAG: hypothetical protein AAFQ64_18130 [Pseudomonadota bacterium]
MTGWKRFLLAAMPVLLVACGGAGSQVTTRATLQNDLLGAASIASVTPAELASALNTFSADFGNLIEPGDPNAGPAFFDPSDFATDGVARYDGYIGIGPDVGNGNLIENNITNTDFSGRVNFAIGLDSDIVVGVASGFIENETGDNLDGTLIIDAALNRTNPLDFGIQGKIDGTLTHEDGRVSTIVGDEIVADLFGDGADALSGDGEGVLTTRDANGNQLVDESYTFDLDIVATLED